MAAGDYKAGLTHYRVTPGAGIDVEFRHGTEAKDGTVETRGESEQFTPPELATILTQQERDALAAIGAKLFAATKGRKVKFANALDLP